MDKPFVLIADDNEGTCTLIAALLQHEYVVDVARDGAEAIERVTHRRYAAIILDLLMPHVDGYAVLDHLAANAPEQLERVVIVTAALSPKQQQRVRAYSVHAVIPKPFEIDALLDAVRNTATPSDGRFSGGPLLSGGMMLLLADLLPRVQ